MILPATRWECPSCNRQVESTKAGIPLHPCLAQGGLLVPFSPFGEKTRHVPVERGDYLNGDQVSPTMAVRTERADGSNDVHVFAPPATAQQE